MLCVFDVVVRVVFRVVVVIVGGGVNDASVVGNVGVFVIVVVIIFDVVVLVLGFVVADGRVAVVDVAIV